MLSRINRWRKGYLKVRISGFSSERFLNLCCSNQIDMWSLEPGKEECVCCMSLPSFRKTRPLVRKSKVRLRILNRCGFPFFVRRNRKRKGLLLGFCSFFLLLYILSLFIWNISFEGNYHYSRDTLLAFLEQEEIQYGMLKKAISCDRLEEELRSNFPEITWVSARVSGTRLLVKLKENEVLSDIPQKSTEPQELAALQSGTITRMVVRQGKAQVSIGDQVEAGQLLVSGILELKNDSGEVIRNAFVHAEGEIYAVTHYAYEERFSKYHTVEAKTGRRRYGVSIKAGPYEGCFLAPAWGDSSWSYTIEHTQLCLLEDFYLPVYLGKIIGEEYTAYERPYTKEEAKNLSEKFHEKYLKNLVEKGVQIIENNVKIEENGNFYRIEGTVTGEEQIAAARPVSNMPSQSRENEETIEEQ